MPRETAWLIDWLTWLVDWVVCFFFPYLLIDWLTNWIINLFMYLFSCIFLTWLFDQNRPILSSARIFFRASLNPNLADWSDKSDWYCRTVHCFQRIWFSKRAHPNEYRNGHQLSTKRALSSDQSSVRSWPCAANKGVVCGRAVCRKGLCIN